MTRVQQLMCLKMVAGSEQDNHMGAEEPTSCSGSLLLSGKHAYCRVSDLRLKMLMKNVLVSIATPALGLMQVNISPLPSSYRKWNGDFVDLHYFFFLQSVRFTVKSDCFISGCK